MDKVDFHTLQNEQANDQQLQDIFNANTKRNSSYTLKQVHIPLENVDIWCETSTGVDRPYVPESLRRTIFHMIHKLSHPGIRTTRKLVASKYFWPSMNKKVNLWAKTCISCQRAKINRHISSPHGVFKNPTARFEHVHMDIVGPLPPSNGFNYILTIKDRFSQWPEAIPLRNIEAKTVSNAFLHNWISRFGVCRTITTDQGTQFQSSLFKELSSILGNHRIRTTTYHPQSNGSVERFHRQLKTAIRALPNPKNWYPYLPWILLGLRSALIDDFGISPSQLLYGQALRLPGEFITRQTPPEIKITTAFAKDIQKTLLNIQPRPVGTRKQKGIFVPQDIITCSHVFIKEHGHKGGLNPPYTGPYKILSRQDKVFKVFIDGKQEFVNIDRIKPSFLTHPDISVPPVVTRANNAQMVTFNL